MIRFGVSQQSKGPAGVVGKSFTSLFFLVFLGMGLLFVGLIAREGVADFRTWAWKKTPCEIISSGVRDTDQRGQRTGDFYLDIKFRYTFEGQELTSDRVRRQTQTYSDFGEAARLATKYQATSSAVCYVNPAAPTVAILEQAKPWILLLALFPMIFVAIGAGGIYYTWRPKSEVVQPISDRAAAAKGQQFLIFFFLIFFLMGSGFFYGFFLRPVRLIYTARAWPAIECVVISSNVRSQSGSKGGMTYSVNILYRYEVNGREYEANRYNFMGGSSSGRSGKANIVSQHPPGSKTICYVNPDDPTDAVMERGFAAEMLIGLFPLIFVAIGVSGMIFAIRARRKNSSVVGGLIKPISAGRPGATAIFSQPASPTATVLLKSKMSPVKKMLGTIAVALFWNGIVSVFVLQEIHGWRTGAVEWFLVLFMIPFELIGLGFIIAVVYSLLALFNPRPKLRLTPGAVPLGGTFRLQWEITGRAWAIQRLRLRVEGREEATYRRGTNTSTDKSVFADMEIANLTNSKDMMTGSRNVTIPAGLMHSFTAPNNKIIWAIHVHGEIPRWPDVREEFPLTITPLSPTPEPAP